MRRRTRSNVRGRSRVVVIIDRGRAARALYHDCAGVQQRGRGRAVASPRCSGQRVRRRLPPFVRDGPPALRPDQPRRARARISRGARECAPGRAGAGGGQGQRLRPRPACACCPALEDADGLALVELDAAVALREQHYTRRILLLEGFFDGARAAGDRARAGSPSSCTTPSRCACSRRRVLARPLEVFVKVNTGMNRLGLRARRGRRRRASASTHCESVAALRLMTHLARADEDDGIAGAARGVRRARAGACRIRARSPTRPASSATPRSAATSCVPASCCTARRRFRTTRAEMLGLRPVMTLRSRDHRRAGPEGQRQRRLRRGVHGVARASHRRRRLRLRRRLSAPRAERHAGARVRQEGAHGGPRVDGHDDGRPDRRAGGARRQPGRAVGRGPAGRRRRERRVDRRLRAAVRASRRACRSSPPTSARVDLEL